MSMNLNRTLPGSCEETRRRLFKGEVYLTSPTEASRILVEKVIEDLREGLKTQDIRRAHMASSTDEFFHRMGRLRRHFYLEPAYHRRLREVAESCGFDRLGIAFDPIRIRVVLPGGHRNRLAAPVYFAHRDTWYSHPQSLIVWWIPLHDLRAEETFQFYPEEFERAVDNDSEGFDYSEWIKDGPELRIGWQQKESGVRNTYPRADAGGCHGEGFSCRAAEMLLFSGSQFHQTLEQDLGTIRFSLDFRVVHLDDLRSGAGALNVDNRSRGDTTGDYIHPEKEGR